MDPFFVVLAFAVAKIAIGLTVIYFGLRGGDASGDDDGFRPPAPEPPPPAGPSFSRRLVRRRSVRVAPRGRPHEALPRRARRERV